MSNPAGGRNSPPTASSLHQAGDVQVGDVVGDSSSVDSLITGRLSDLRRRRESHWNTTDAPPETTDPPHSTQVPRKGSIGDSVQENGSNSVTSPEEEPIEEASTTILPSAVVDHDYAIPVNVQDALVPVTRPHDRVDVKDIFRDGSLISPVLPGVSTSVPPVSILVGEPFHSQRPISDPTVSPAGSTSVSQWSKSLGRSSGSRTRSRHTPSISISTQSQRDNDLESSSRISHGLRERVDPHCLEKAQTSTLLRRFNRGLLGIVATDDFIDHSSDFQSSRHTNGQLPDLSASMPSHGGTTSVAASNNEASIPQRISDLNDRAIDHEFSRYADPSLHSMPASYQTTREPPSLASSPTPHEGESLCPPASPRPTIKTQTDIPSVHNTISRFFAAPLGGEPFDAPRMSSHIPSIAGSNAFGAAGTWTPHSMHRPGSDGSGMNYGDWTAKRDFIILLGRALYAFGAPTYRLQHHVQMVAKSFEMRTNMALFPDLILMGFANPYTGRNDSHIINVKSGFDLSKLYLTNKLCKRVAEDAISLMRANHELMRIIQLEPIYPVWLTALAYPLMSFSIAILLFEGSWMDALVAGLGGLLVYGLDVATAFLPPLSNVYEVVAAVMLTVLAMAFTKVSENSCFAATAIGGLVMLLPGLTIVSSFLEISSNNTVLGAVTLALGLVKSILLGFGVDLGMRISRRFAEHPNSVSRCEVVTGDEVDQVASSLTNFLFLLPVYATAHCVLFRVLPRQIPLILLHVTISFCLIEYWSKLLGTFIELPNELGVMFSSLILGLVANIYSRVTGNPAYTILLSGIVMQVPGTFGLEGAVRGLEGILPNGAAADNQQVGGQFGIDVALRMIVVSISLSMGLLFSRIFVHPIDNPLEGKRFRRKAGTWKL